MRVLVVKLSSLGDVIHTLPALSDAVAAVPGIRFDWAVEEAFVEVPQWHAGVDTVIPIALRRWRKKPLRDLHMSEWREARKALRQQHYDAVIDAQGLMKSAFVARVVKAPRYGMDRQSVRERLASSVYHHSIFVPREMHAVERIRLLFAQALNYPLPSSPGDYALRASLVSPQRVSPPGLVFFHGTARSQKLWPPERWVELADLAVARGYTVWLPWGSEAERLRAEQIAARCSRGLTGGVVVLPRMNLTALANFLQEVHGVVAVDTGLGHLGAALDVPGVSLYGPTKCGLIGTYGANQVHIGPGSTSSPASSASTMPSITVAAVWRALQPLLGNSIARMSSPFAAAVPPGV